MKYQRNSKTISGRLSDELVMMDMDKGKYFSLNPVATRIWDLLADPMSVEELCNLLMDEYEVEANQCKKDVEDVIAKMKKLNIVLEKK